MGRTRIVAAAIVVALVVVGYGAWWLRAAGMMHRAIDAWVETHRAQGWHVDLEGVTVQGFPLRLEVVTQRFAIGRDLPARWRWTGPRLSASLPPWIGHEVALSFPGAHVLDYPGEDGPRVMLLQAGKAHGTARIGDDGRVESVAMTLETIQATLPGLGAAKVGTFELSIAGPSAPVASGASDPHAPDAGRLSLAADGIELPERVAPALGRHIDHATIQLALKGAIPTAPTRAALESWRDAGGTVELERLQLNWGAFQLEAQGAAALDASLQPEGALTARAWGIGAAIDALVAAGEVRPREGATAKVVLHTMAKPRTDQGIPPEVEAPFAVQDGKLYLGPVPLARMPVIVWP